MLGMFYDIKINNQYLGLYYTHTDTTTAPTAIVTNNQYSYCQLINQSSNIYTLLYKSSDLFNARYLGYQLSTWVGGGTLTSSNININFNINLDINLDSSVQQIYNSTDSYYLYIDRGSNSNENNNDLNGEGLSTLLPGENAFRVRINNYTLSNHSNRSHIRNEFTFIRKHFI